MDYPVASRRPLTWKGTFQWVAAIVVACLLAALTYGRQGWVPLLSYADLGIHELGHLLAFWAPDVLVWGAGSFLQVALPLLVGAYFYRWRHDRFALLLMLAWAAESVNNVSVYIYDATRMRLALLGDDGSGTNHDWRNILRRLGWLEHTETIAYVVRGLSVVLFAVAMSLAAWWWVKGRRSTAV